MKTLTSLVFISCCINGALAQIVDDSDENQAEYAVPAVVYEAPVVYQAPVLYQMPVIYYGPVYYVSSLAGVIPRYEPVCPPVSTVITIGGRGGVYSYSNRPVAAAGASSVTYIGGTR